MRQIEEKSFLKSRRTRIISWALVITILFSAFVFSTGEIGVIASNQTGGAGSTTPAATPASVASPQPVDPASTVVREDSSTPTKVSGVRATATPEGSGVGGARTPTNVPTEAASPTEGSVKTPVESPTEVPSKEPTRIPTEGNGRATATKTNTPTNIPTDTPTVGISSTVVAVPVSFIRVYVANVVPDACIDNEWEFDITGIDTLANAPASITVEWASGVQLVVNRSSFSGGTAKYVTTANLNARVTRAYADIYDTWSGSFRLAHGPCFDKIHVPDGNPAVCDDTQWVWQITGLRDQPSAPTYIKVW